MASSPVSRSSGVPRISQRQPTACTECSRRKVRCDKQIPCSRCVRLRKHCSREVVRTTKAVSANREELELLRGLLLRLPHDENGNVRSELQARINLLEDVPMSPSSETSGSQAVNLGVLSDARSTPTPIGDMMDRSPDPYGSGTPAAKRFDPAHKQNALTMRRVESLAWSRNSGACYPHRRCDCPKFRKYSELASINADLDSPALEWRPLVRVEPSVLPPVADARKIVQFHIDQLWWHHNAFHAPTFLAQCEFFWTSGTAVHPLWAALYLSVICTSLWSLLNSPSHLRDIGIEFNDDVVERQYSAMVQVLYDECFLDNPSMFSVQAIVLSTRVAHNLGRSDPLASFVTAAIGIAQTLGLHKICKQVPDANSAAQVSRSDWFESVEIEIGKRTWWQLVIQDHFSIPFTETYVIHPAQFLTDMPTNCDDHDLLRRSDEIATSSSYVRIVAREAVLMTPVLDGLGPLASRKPLPAIYEHILKCDQNMRLLVQQIPPFLLRDTGPQTPQASSLPVWLHTARRTLAISAADKIIMMHRPVLFYSFTNPAFAKTRATCTAAALTILREHEQAATDDATLSVWTQSAFCITAAVVLGLDLLHRDDHTDQHASELRHMLAKAADRLRARRLDVLAAKGARLIDVFLAVEEDLVIKVMRKRGGNIKEKQREAIGEIIKSQEILARFLDFSTSLQALEAIGPSPVSMASLEFNFNDMDSTEDFDVWFQTVFEPNYHTSIV